MATDIPSVQKATSPRQKVALEKAIEAAVDGAKADVISELKAIVASAATYAEFQTDIAAWTASP